MAAIIGLVGGAFLILYVASQRYLVQDIRLIATQGEASYAMEHITRNLVRADRVPDLPVSPDPESGRRLMFRYWDPGIGRERWIGYRLDLPNSTAIEGTLNFYDLGSPIDPNAVPSFPPNAATGQSIASNVLGPGPDPDANPSNPLPPIPPLFESPRESQVEIDLTVRTKAGSDVRRTRLRTTVSPRGVTGS